MGVAISKPIASSPSWTASHKGNSLKGTFLGSSEAPSSGDSSFASPVGASGALASWLPLLGWDASCCANESLASCVSVINVVIALRRLLQMSGRKLWFRQGLKYSVKRNLNPVQWLFWGTNYARPCHLLDFGRSLSLFGNGSGDGHPYCGG